MSLAAAFYTKTALSARGATGLPSKIVFPSIRQYATGPTRRQVTITNDNGSVAWNDLSGREKAARTTQQTFNFGLVVLGALSVGVVGYYLYDAVISPDSKVSHFNRAVDELKASPRVRDLLGPANKIVAYGDRTSMTNWTRNRIVASTLTRDQSGRENMTLEFHLEGPRGRGVVFAHLIRNDGAPHFEYKVLKLDVPDHATVYLHNTSARTQDRSGFKFLGLTWK